MTGTKRRSMAASQSPTMPAHWRLLFGMLVILPTVCRADDWPQWLGAQRDGVWREMGIIEQFPVGGPPVRWRADVGAGYAGPAVAAGRVVVMDRIAADRKLSEPT